MARRKKSGSGDGGDPAWLVTFSDLMTLLLTFFVLLLSMAVIDERHKLVALGSVSTAFGLGSNLFNPTAKQNKPSKFEPGPMDSGDLQPIKDMVWDEANKDLDFQENRYVQIISINDELLFEPGGATLSEKGKSLLQGMLPVLLEIRYPLLVAGHSAPRRDEEGAGYQVDLEGSQRDSTWGLSLARALEVYRFLKNRGMATEHLSVEAFGQYRPRYSNATPEGRQRNRRVELVLDKRNGPIGPELANLREPPVRKQGFEYRRFIFRDFSSSAPPGNEGRQRLR